MKKLSDEQILDGVLRAYRTLPNSNSLSSLDTDTMIWISNAKVFLTMAGASIDRDLRSIKTTSSLSAESTYYKNIQQVFLDAIARLEIETGGYAFAIGQGNVFDYFDETRKILESAKQEVLLVDPYVSADIVRDYFRSLDPQISLRILTSKKQSVRQIVPAAEKLSLQNGMTIEVRGADNLHDRFWFIDQVSGYQSSASVKDGGRKSPALIMKITDTLPVILETYEDKWATGEVLTLN